MSTCAIKEIGFSAHLTKPIRRSRLYTCLVMVLKGTRLCQPNDIPGMVLRPMVPFSEKKQQRILIAEDNPANKKLALKMVRQFGYSADGCTNGKEALTALETMNYHLVLMDIQMPVMDGLEATRHIRSPESKVRNRAVKIIAMTAYAMKGDKERCLEAGMDAYVAKPIEPIELRSAIAKQLLNCL
jgi:CheY-like chemotaxis protein